MKTILGLIRVLLILMLLTWLLIGLSCHAAPTLDQSIRNITIIDYYYTPQPQPQLRYLWRYPWLVWYAF